MKKEKKEEEKIKLENKKGECEEEEEEEEVEDGPLAELRRRAPDVTITVVRPGQQTSRTTSSPQVCCHIVPHGCSQTSPLISMYFHL